MTTLTTKTTAAEFRQIASELGLTLVGNARLKATKESWIALIEAARMGKVAPIPAQEPVATTNYTTVEQAVKAAKSKGYSVKIDSDIMKIHILTPEGVTAATVWLTSDVIKWLKTAPNLTIEVETVDDFNEIEKPSDVQAVRDALTVIGQVAEATIAPEPVKAPKRQAPKQEKGMSREEIRADNEKKATEIRSTLEIMGSHLAFEVTNWLTFEAKIYNGKNVIGFVGVSNMTKSAWYRPKNAKISKSVQFPVDGLSSAVSKVIVWDIQENQADDEDEAA